MLCVIKASLTVCLAIVDSMPLIADYVKKESRGQACCMTATFVGGFQIVNFQILIPYSEKVSYQEAFTTVAIVTLAITLLTLFITREPKPKQSEAADLSVNGNKESLYA